MTECQIVFFVGRLVTLLSDLLNPHVIDVFFYITHKVYRSVVDESVSYAILLIYCTYYMGESR
jgi:hypothetical protein